MISRVMYVPSTFAVAIRAGRFLRRMTLGELSRETGVPSARISAFERGAAQPMPEEFGAIWSALSTDPPSVREADADEGER